MNIQGSDGSIPVEGRFSLRRSFMTKTGCKTSFSPCESAPCQDVQHAGDPALGDGNGVPPERRCNRSAPETPVGRNPTWTKGPLANLIVGDAWLRRNRR